MIAQGLAVKRMDLIRGIVLSNTAAKIGQSSMWDDRIRAVQTDGIESLADSVMERWFSKKFLVRLYKQLLVGSSLVCLDHRSVSCSSPNRSYQG